MALGAMLNVTIGDRTFSVRFGKAYGDVPIGDYLGLFGSGEVFEVAINQGNLAHKLNANNGDRIEIWKR